MATDHFLDGYFFIETFERIFAFELFELSWCVLVKELIYGKITTPYADSDLVLKNLHVDFLCSELVDTVALTHEHDLEFLSVREIVDVLGQLLVDQVIFDWNVNGDS